MTDTTDTPPSGWAWGWYVLDKDGNPKEVSQAEWRASHKGKDQPFVTIWGANRNGTKVRTVFHGCAGVLFETFIAHPDKRVEIVARTHTREAARAAMDRAMSQVFSDPLLPHLDPTSPATAG